MAFGYLATPLNDVGDFGSMNKGCDNIIHYQIFQDLISNAFEATPAYDRHPFLKPVQSGINY